MKRPKQYLLDGEPVDFRELIKCAQNSGYENKDGIYSISGAAHFLRTRCGCTVENNPDCKTG